MRARRLALALVALLVASACAQTTASDAGEQAPPAGPPLAAPSLTPRPVRLPHAGMEAMLAQLFASGDAMEDGVGELLLSLQELMQAPQLLAPGAGSLNATDDGTAAAGAMLANLFTGADSPFASFLDGSGSAFPSFLSFGTGAGASAAQRPAPRLATGTGGTAPLADMLQPVAQSRAAVTQQLQAALQQAKSVLRAPMLDDLFGGVELGGFLSGDRAVLATSLAAAEVRSSVAPLAARVMQRMQQPGPPLSVCRRRRRGTCASTPTSSGARRSPQPAR